MTPSYLRVQIDGREMADFLILIDASVTHELNRHPECVLRYRQPPSSRYFYEPDIGKTFVAKAVDAEGAELELFNGLLARVDADWEMNGSCVMTFRAVGHSYKLDTQANSQTFNHLGLQDCAARLLADQAGDYVCTEPGNLMLIQYDETDWSFVHRLVDRYGGFLRVKGTRVDIFDEFQPEVVDLSWRAENGLQSLRTTGQLKPHLTFGVNFDTSRATSEQTDMNITEVSAEESVPDLRSGAYDGSANLGLTTGVWDKFLSGTHDKFADLLGRESERQIIHTCTIEGESRAPEILVGGKVNLTGDLDVPGHYGVFKVVHTWVPALGYRNRFWATPYKKYLNPVRPNPARNFGPVVARVAEIGCPHERCVYVRVNFIWNNNNDTGWVKVLTPNAGAGRGFCFTPEVGDQVLVAFDGGDSCRPFILGSLWNGVDHAPLEDLHGGEYQNNDIKRIVTKSGNRLVFDDKDGQETMVMATPNHVRVSLFDGGQTLLLHSDGNINIHAGGTIHMRCAQFLREVG